MEKAIKIWSLFIWNFLRWSYIRIPFPIFLFFFCSFVLRILIRVGNNDKLEIPRDNSRSGGTRRGVSSALTPKKSSGNSEEKTSGLRCHAEPKKDDRAEAQVCSKSKTWRTPRCSTSGPKTEEKQKSDRKLHLSETAQQEHMTHGSIVSRSR